MPIEYVNLYKSLVNQKVKFPDGNRMLNASVSNSMHGSNLGNSKPRFDFPLDNGSAPVNNDFTGIVLPNLPTDDYTGIMNMYTENLNMRENIAGMIIENPFDENLPIMYEAYDDNNQAMVGHPTMEKLKVDNRPANMELLRDINNEIQLHREMKRAFQVMQQTNDGPKFVQDVASAYKNVLDRDLLADRGLKQPEPNQMSPGRQIPFLQPSNEYRSPDPPINNAFNQNRGPGGNPLSLNNSWSDNQSLSPPPNRNRPGGRTSPSLAAMQEPAPERVFTPQPQYNPQPQFNQPPQYSPPRNFNNPPPQHNRFSPTPDHYSSNLTPPKSKITDSSLMKTPNAYEEERQRQRDRKIQEREREFQRNLDVIRGQAQVNKSHQSLGPLNWSIGPERVRDTFTKAGSPVFSIEKQMMNEIKAKHLESEIQLKAQLRENQMSNHSLDMTQRELRVLDAEKDRMMNDASRMNTDNELIANDVKNMKRLKEELHMKLERKRAELLELKKEGTSTSANDEAKRTQMRDLIMMMAKLSKMKQVELYRNKKGYEQLERDYQEHNLKRMKAQADAEHLRKSQHNLTTSVIDRASLDKSGLSSSFTPRDLTRMRDLSAEIRRNSLVKPHHTKAANLSRNMGDGEGSRFLADFNRDMETIIQNTSFTGKTF